MSNGRTDPVLVPNGGSVNHHPAFRSERAVDHFHGAEGAMSYFNSYSLSW
jgi:hypothetical protein